MNLPDLGSYIAACRPDLCSGNNFAEGWSDPVLQNAGSSAGRILAVNQTRPMASSIGL